MKIKIKGFLSKVGDREGTTPKQFQRIEISMPRFDKWSGEKQGEDIYPGVIFEKQIDPINAGNFLGMKVEVDGFLNSSEKEHNGKVYRDLYFSAQQITLIN